MNKLVPVVLLSLLTICNVFGDDPRNTVAIVKSPEEDYIEICGREIDGEGGGYSKAVVDLNSDGIDDWMLAKQSTSGTGGEAATVYLGRVDGNFTRVGSILHQGLATEELRTGGVILHCSSNGGGGHSSIATYFLSHEGLKELMVVKGEWKEEKYSKLFAEVFVKPLKVEYKFVEVDGA